VTPGKGGQDVEGIPVFDTFHRAVQETGANTAMVFVPPRFAADSILEAEDAGIELIVTITEGIPAHDELKVYNHLARNPNVRLVGPNCPGSSPPARRTWGSSPPPSSRRGTWEWSRAPDADLPDRQRTGPERLREQLDRRHRRRPRCPAPASST
jgi:succinyl-CoA synthetase alpha subunit